MPAGIADEVAIGATILTTVISALFVNKIPRTRGRLPLVSGPLATVGGLIIHVGYVFLAIIILNAIPTVSPGLDKVLFSEFGVVIVGTALPLMESIRAVLTVRTDDDTAWLSYWLAFGCFQFSTEHLDTIADSGGVPFIKEHWHEIEFFVLLWCWFPLTDGASLTYDLITRPLLMPLLAPLKAQVDGLVAAAINFGINCGYSYALWWILAFSMYPTSMQRFFVIVLGTAYPIFASLFAVATDDKEDDTFWLTYWISYNILFCSMDLIENYIGGIPGFYALCMFATVYLLLPMFRGAEQVFRNVIVPLSGQAEALMVADAHKLRKDVERKIGEAHKGRALSIISSVFSAPAADKKAN